LISTPTHYSNKKLLHLHPKILLYIQPVSMLAQQSLHTRENMLKIERRCIFAPLCIPGVHKYSRNLGFITKF